MRELIDKYKRLNSQARASLWFLFANVFQKAVMIFFTPVFTRILTTEEFSKYAVFQSWEAIFTVFATLNISSYATAKALVDSKNDEDKFIFSAEILTVLLSVIVFITYYVARFFFKGLDVFPLPIMISLFCDIVFVAIFNFWSQLERYFLRYRALVICSLFVGILSPVLAYLLIRYSNELGLYKGWARIVSTVFLDGLVAIIIFSAAMRKSHCKIRINDWKYCVSYCIPLIPHFLAAAFLQKASQLFVDHYAGENASGIFALANSLALMMMVFNDALTKTMVPWTYKKLADKKYDVINRPIVASLIGIGVLDLLMCLLAPEIVTIFADAAYKEAIYAIPPLVGVCFFGFIYNAYTNIEYYYQETKYVSIASVCAGITIVLSEFITVPKWGFIAAAYSALFSYCVYAIVHYIFMIKTMNKHIPGITIYNNNCILKISLVFVLLILLMPILYIFRYLRYAIMICIGILLCLKIDKIVLFIRGNLNENGK